MKTLEEGELARERSETERMAALLVRYWGLGKTLDLIEKEELLVALDEENKALDGPLHVRALERLREKGIA